MKRPAILLFVTLTLLVGCSDPDSLQELADFEKEVASNQLGFGRDHWVEMRNITGQRERVGLMFGYADDFEECEKAALGLRSANPSRQYRRVPAQP